MGTQVTQPTAASKRLCPQTIAAIALTLSLIACSAQAPAGNANRPSFEVATIKPFDPGAGVADYTGDSPSPTRPVWVGNLRHFIKTAYSVEDSQISEGPNRLDPAFFEIDALTPAPASVDQEHLMLQTLLQDRFKLALHRETKQLPVYSLVVAKSGSKLKRADQSDAASAISSTTGATSNLRGPMDTSIMAHQLTALLGRTVLDNTGLTETYKISLEWSAEDGPSIFTAVQEQLGLKLEPATGPAALLVIDHAEKPSPN